MKTFLTFIAGMATMLVLVIILGVLFNSLNGDGYPGLTIFEKDGKCIAGARQIKVMQTLEPDMALSHAKTQPNAIFDENEVLVLLLGDENANFYDDQKINIPKDKCARQVGTFQYEAKNGMKTVPAVKIK